MRKRKLLFSLISAILFFTLNSLMASPADPTPRVIVMPDGTEVTLIIKGDEKVRWAETLDGYTVLSASDGFYKYAYRSDNGDLSISEQIANNPENRYDEENAFLTNIDTRLLYSKSQVSTLKSIWDIKSKVASKGFPTTGDRNLIMILIGYSDKAFSKSQADFNNLMNQANYSVNGATGSVQEYFSDNSFGELTVNTIVAGPYTASHNMAYYGGEVGSDDDSDPRALVSEAIELADADVDFSEADNDGDGYVDGIYILYAGYGEEAGGGDTAIWAHAWGLSTPVEKDGVSISRYSCSAELSGNSGSTITNIGVICHEFSHVCGLPDFYDTDYAESGGQSFDLGSWDCMAGGSWNNGGKTPPFHNAYSRNALGWQTTTLLETTQNVELLNSAENNVSYKFLTTTADEYFMVENRQNIKWDAHIPHHGMLIYHVDLNYDGWNSNDINCVPDHQGMDIEEADGTATDISTSGDVFPGTSNVTTFTDATMPNAKSWAGASTNKPISNIVEDGTGKITFHIDFTESTVGTEIFVMKFEADEDISVWTLRNNNNDDKEWEAYTQYGIDDTGSAGYGYSETVAADDWLFSPKVRLEKGKEYEANFFYKAFDNAFPEKLGFYYGKTNSAMTDVIEDLGTISNESYQLSSNTITVASTDDYYFGWYCYSEANQSYVFIDNIAIVEILAAEFEVSDVVGTTPLVVNFTDKSAGEPTNWSWDFNNDGTEDSDLQNPTYEYTTAGTYSVALTVTNADGSNKITKPDYIVVNDPVPVVANFSTDKTEGFAPLMIDFTDTSTGDPTGWSWDFNNDGTEDSNVQNPTYEYAVPGTYSVSLTVINASSNDKVTKTDFIVVNEVVPIVAEFKADTTSGHAPLVVKFTDMSTGDPNTWSWDFNNDGTEDSFLQNPTYTFAEAGIYTVSLTASNNQTSDELAKTDYISVRTVGITELKDNSTWALFPNPASNQVGLLFLTEMQKEVSIEIYNTNGQKFYAETFTSIEKESEIVIDLSEFENGVYFVKVFNGETSSLEKLIIQ